VQCDPKNPWCYIPSLLNRNPLTLTMVLYSPPPFPMRMRPFSLGGYSLPFYAEAGCPPPPHQVLPFQVAEMSSTALHANMLPPFERPCAQFFLYSRFCSPPACTPLFPFLLFCPELLMSLIPPFATPSALLHVFRVPLIMTLLYSPLSASSQGLILVCPDFLDFVSGPLTLLKLMKQCGPSVSHQVSA